MPGCVTACCNALTALPSTSLDFDDLLAIYSPGQGPIPLSLMNNTDFKPVLAAALSKLLQFFGDVPTIVASPTLTAQLLQLPHIAILALLGSDLLTTDCEDSVLMLLSWWLEGDKGTERVTDPEHMTELKQLVRYSRLSPTYLAQTASTVPRLSPSLAQLLDLTQFRSFTTTQCTMYSQKLKSACPASWFKPQRPLSAGKGGNTVTVDLLISTAQLSKHLPLAQKLEEAGPVPPRLSAAIDFRGLSICLAFDSSKSCNGTGSKLTGEVRVCARLPDHSSMADLPLGFPFSSKVSIHSNVPSKPLHTLSIPACFHTSGWGWANFAHIASKLPGDPLLLSWWDPFIIDGHVKMTAQVTDERAH